MLGCWILLSLLAAGEAGAGQEVFQIVFHAGGVVLARAAPIEKEGRLVFRRHPDGVLLSVRKSEVSSVTTMKVKPQASLRPGGQLDIGVTGEGATRPVPGSGKPPSRPGEGAAGVRLVSPSGRYYVPGYNLPFPPRPAVQQAPGEPPAGVQTGPPSTRPD